MVVRSFQEIIRNSRDSIAKAERRLAELLDDGEGVVIWERWTGKES